MLSVKQILHCFPSGNRQRENKLCRQASELYRWNRSSVANGVMIGLFCAMLPLPVQSIIAIAVGIMTKAYLPLAVGLVWLTNPLTIIPIATTALWLGCYLLGLDAGAHSALNSTGILEAAKTYWLPFFVGCLSMGLALSSCGYFLTLLAWKKFGMDKWRPAENGRAQPF